MDKFILDKKEENALRELGEKYQKFTKKSLINVGAENIIKKSKIIIPQQMQEFFENKYDEISKIELWKKVMEMASNGFVVLQGVMAKYTISEKDILKRMKRLNCNINSLDDFYELRSYEIEKVITLNDWKVHIQNILQSAPTGFAGMAGLPFNIVLATFIQFRVVQLTAMYYGYNVKCVQQEMDYASAVYLQIISKGQITDVDGYGELIAKMMAQAQLSSLRNALKSKTYADMAGKGGIQLLYVQMRAISNKAAQKAINKVGEKSIENQALKEILEALSKKMTQKAGAKSLPIISAVLSTLIDTYQVNKVLKMANIIYQKRFLIEKEMLNYTKSDEDQLDDFLKPEDEDSVQEGWGEAAVDADELLN